MNEKLLEKDDEVVPFKDEKFDEQYKQVVDNSKNADYQNPIQILKLRLAKIVATNKEKKRLMD